MWPNVKALFGVESTTKQEKTSYSYIFHIAFINFVILGSVSLVLTYLTFQDSPITCNIRSDSQHTASYYEKFCLKNGKTFTVIRYVNLTFEYMSINFSSKNRWVNMQGHGTWRFSPKMKGLNPEKIKSWEPFAICLYSQSCPFWVNLGQSGKFQRARTIFFHFPG